MTWRDVIAKGGWLCFWLILGLLIGSHPTEASVPGIDPLERPVNTSGTVEIWVKTQFRPGGDEKLVWVQEGVAQLLDREREWVTQLGFAQHLSERTSYWSEWVLIHRQRWSALRLAEESEVQQWERLQSTGIIGLRHRWAPSSLLDPHLGVSVSTVGRVHVDTSIARIVDPAIVLFSIGRSFQLPSGSATTDKGRVDVSGGIGLVLNDKMTLFLGLGYSHSNAPQQLDSASLSVRWNWETDPLNRQAIGVWGVFTQAGGRGEVSLGIEWNYLFSRAEKS